MTTTAPPAPPAPPITGSGPGPSGPGPSGPGSAGTGPPAPGAIPPSRRRHRLDGITGSLRLPVTAALATVTTMISLGPAFLRATWFFPAVVAVAVVAVGAQLTRRFATSRAVVPLGGAAALLFYLLLRYAAAETWWLLPTPAAVDRLRALVEAGRSDIARYSAPIGVSPGVELLTVAGVGLVALTVDTLAVTLRRAALAGLPLLVLYTVPIAVAPEGVSWLAFTLAGVGFLALLLAESRERVSRWGRPMRQLTTRAAPWTPPVETAPLAAVGRRVGAVAIGLALLVPAVLPDLGSTGFGFGSGGFGDGGGGGSKVSVVNPIVDLGRSLRQPANRPVISYRGPATYLRFAGLDEFTGDQWRPSELEVSRDDNDVEDGLSPPPGLGAGVSTTVRRYRIEIYNLENTWLPLPYPSTKVSDIEGTWLYDEETFNVFGENASTLQLDYRVRALDVAPTAEQLREAPEAPESMGRYLQLPADLPDAVVIEARNVTDGIRDDYGRALALQDWLRDSQNFTYDTEVGATVGDGNGSEAILRFLQERTGYCVHFASTMAVMARLLDIPARVAVGFTAGTPDRTGARVVTLHDAHSWPELYFEGVGWVAFEPTPAVRTGEPPPWAQAENGGGPDLPVPTESATPGAQPSAGAGAANPRNLEGRSGLTNDQAGGGAGGGLQAGPVRIPLLPLLVGLGVLLLLAVPALARLLVRRHRWSRAGDAPSHARAAWADLQDSLIDFGHHWDASDTPRSGVHRLVRDRRLPPEAAAAAHRLADATERARYAPTMAATGDLRADAATVRSGLAGAAGRWTRVRAWLLPRSAKAVSDALGERVADALDAIDAAAAKLGQRMRPRRS